MTRRALHASLGIPAMMFALTACDTFLVDPAPAKAGLAVNFSLSSSAAGGLAAAYDKSDQIGIAFFTANSLRAINLSEVNRGNVESIVLSAAVGPLITQQFTPAAEARIRVEIPDNLEDFGVAVALGQANRPLFLGLGFGRAERGSVTPLPITLFPIPDRVLVTPTAPVFGVVGQSAVLRPAVVFASNDTIPGYTFSYQSSNTRVATVDQNGRVTAAGPGTAQVTVTARDLTFTLTTTVSVTVASTSGSIRSTPVNVAGRGGQSDEGATGVARRIS